MLMAVVVTRKLVCTTPVTVTYLEAWLLLTTAHLPVTSCCSCVSGSRKHSSWYVVLRAFLTSIFRYYYAHDNESFEVPCKLCLIRTDKQNKELIFLEIWISYLIRISSAFNNNTRALSTSVVPRSDISMREHTWAYVSIRLRPRPRRTSLCRILSCVRIREHTWAYVSRIHLRTRPRRTSLCKDALS
jgi:hypothetical protein